MVQEALNRASEGKSSITVSHRKSTIKNSDVIYVISEKKVKESGTYKELISAQGLFCAINNTLLKKKFC